MADFGIAKAAYSTATTTGTLFGTAMHISPEQAKGEPAGPSSDLYSLGVVLYEMLTGELPYNAETSIGTAMKYLNEAPRSLRGANPNVPEALDALTTKLLAKKSKSATRARLPSRTTSKGCAPGSLRLSRARRRPST